MNNYNMFHPKVVDSFKEIETPFYFYDTHLLKNTLEDLKKYSGDYHIHYALKANPDRSLLKIILENGIGADCVSGNEVKRAVECNFKTSEIVFAGVGKNDKEINYALDQSIFCFNAESIEELNVMNQLAKNKNCVAPVALRINPNVDAHTHKYITTGLEENKFGINPFDFDRLLESLKSLKNINVIGLHFHIGSQIKDLTVFKNLCLKVNDLNHWFKNKGLHISHLNLGGGLGIDYTQPDKNSIVDFESFFAVFKEYLKPYPNQQIHFELGRAIIGQCSSLISRVLYVKKGFKTNFLILDAGMTELMRPALYQAFHKIENISKLDSVSNHKYDVVGPICESSDCFGKAVELPESERGNLIAIRSAGAYGEVMSNRYNLRDEVKSIFI